MSMYGKKPLQYCNQPPTNKNKWKKKRKKILKITHTHTNLIELINKIRKKNYESHFMMTSKIIKIPRNKFNQGGEITVL